MTEIDTERWDTTDARWERAVWIISDSAGNEITRGKPSEVAHALLPAGNPDDRSAGAQTFQLTVVYWSERP